MMDGSTRRNWRPLLGSMLCVALVGLLDVTGPGTSIRDALVLQQGEPMRATLRVTEQLGLVFASGIAIVLPVRLLVALFGGCYVALMALTLLVGSLSPWRLFVLAALSAALGLLVWVQLIQQALPLARHPRHSVAVLALTLATLVTVGNSGLLSPVLLEGHPRLALLTSGLVALVLSLSAAALPDRNPEPAPRRDSWLKAAVGLVLVSVVVSMAAGAVTDTLFDPQHLPTDPPWLQALGVLAAEVGVFGLLIGAMQRRPETSSLRLIALTLLVSAALTPACALYSNQSWSTGAGFVAAFAGGLAALCVTLLMLVTAAHAPHRFVGPVVGVWFVSKAWVVRGSSSVIDWAREGGVFISGVALVIPCLLASCALVLLMFNSWANEGGG